MNFVLQIIGWVLLLYGFFSLIQDIVQEVSSKKINHNMKIIIFGKKIEKNLDEFSKDLHDIRRKNSYKNIILIDMESEDVHKIEDKFEENEVNMKVLDKKQGAEYIDELFELWC